MRFFLPIKDVLLSPSSQSNSPYLSYLCEIIISAIWSKKVAQVYFSDCSLLTFLMYQKLFENYLKSIQNNRKKWNKQKLWLAELTFLLNPCSWTSMLINNMQYVYLFSSPSWLLGLFVELLSPLSLISSPIKRSLLLVPDNW